MSQEKNRINRNRMSMKTMSAILSVVCVLVCVAVMVWFARGEREKQRVSSREFFAMNTYFSLRTYGANGEEALLLCEEETKRLETYLSVTEEGSDVWRLNREKSANVSEDTFRLVTEAVEAGRQTKGALDITLYPVLLEWGFTTGEYQIPDEDRIKELLKNVDFRQIKAEEMPKKNTPKENAPAENIPSEDMTAEGTEEEKTGYRITIPDQAQIDLGSVAKGYTGDRMLEILRGHGVTSAILDLGGNVQALGAKPDGSPWRVAVRGPFDRSQTIGVLNITDKCVITSGGYERYFTGEDGKVYWNILDPADGYPADSGLVSVTVVWESGVRCDALSTALFVMGKELAEEFWRSQGDFEAILVGEDGEIYVTEGLEDCFECSENLHITILKRKKS